MMKRCLNVFARVYKRLGNRLFCCSSAVGYAWLSKSGNYGGGDICQGASIELSADGPIREPYIAYVQGGLTFEGGKLGKMMSLQNLIDNKLITL
jgi:cystathionine beta-lyase family protein involved in aluminum resistance